MKTITYCGKYPEIDVSGLGRCKKGESISVPDDVADNLLKSKNWNEGRKTISKKDIKQ